MDIILAVVAVACLFLISFFIGLAFFFGGINKLLNFDPDHDEIKKKHSAILEVVVCGIFLLVFNAIFWLEIYPLAILYYNLNLLVFAW